MAWVSIVLWVMTHAPELIQIVKAIIDLMHSLPKEDQAQAKVELGEAIKTGDKGFIREKLEKWRKRCTGVGCPMDLVGANHD